MLHRSPSRPVSRVRRAVLALLVTGAAVVLAGVFALPVVLLATTVGLAGGVGSFVVAVVAGEAGYAAVGYAFLQSGDARDVTPSWRVPDRRDAGLVVAGVVATVAFNRVAFRLAARGGVDPVVTVTPPEGLSLGPALLALAPVLVLVVGPAEEYLFRGVVQRYLAVEFSTPAALVLASLLFVAIHLPNFLGTVPRAVLVAGPVLFGVSLCFGWLYEATGTLVVPALVHGLYDLVVLWAVLSQWGMV